MFKDVRLRVFLQVFTDSGDDVPRGFTQKTNVTVCINTSVTIND